jgi:hypothetical protein
MTAEQLPLFAPLPTELWGRVRTLVGPPEGQAMGQAWLEWEEFAKHLADWWLTRPVGRVAIKISVTVERA